jgi:hypothetical protein
MLAPFRGRPHRPNELFLGLFLWDRFNELPRTRLLRLSEKPHERANRSHHQATHRHVDERLASLCEPLVVLLIRRLWSIQEKVRSTTHLRGKTRNPRSGETPFLMFLTIGALVASRRHENPIGWICCAGDFVLGVQSFAFRLCRVRAVHELLLAVRRGARSVSLELGWRTNPLRDGNVLVPAVPHGQAAVSLAFRDVDGGNRWRDERPRASVWAGGRWRLTLTSATRSRLGRHSQLPDAVGWFRSI